MNVLNKFESWVVVFFYAIVQCQIYFLVSHLAKAALYKLKISSFKRWNAAGYEINKMWAIACWHGRFKNKPKVSSMDLRTLPKRIHRTGPQGEVQVEGTGRGQGGRCRHGCGCECGCRWGIGRGEQFPNQLLTSPETMTNIKEVPAKESQEEFVKVTLK